MNLNPSRENVWAYKKQRNMCVLLLRKFLEKHLKSIIKKGINTNKNFGNSLSLFLQTKVIGSTVMIKPL